ncbi:MAG: hypothetical protein JWM96_1334 [Alphaproteobacteria bacterium]|nr:hypothetical protein [Alphaproteobacteria bacterium]
MNVHQFPGKITSEATVADIVFDALTRDKLDRLDAALASVEKLERQLDTVIAKLGTLSAPERLSYSEEEAAAELGMKVATLQAKRRSGRIGATCIAAKWRYTPQDLTEYLNKSRVKPRK